MKTNTLLNQLVNALFSTLILLIVFCSTANAQWQKQWVNANASLRGLSVADKNVVWASGANGTFLRTTDAGKTWKVGKVPDADKLDFRDVEAFDRNTAYLLSIGNGDSSRIYKTTDGGENWTLQFKNTDQRVFLDAFAFWDEQNGIALGDPVDNKFFLLGTSDGGKTWKRIEAATPPAQPGEAAFAASGTCIVTTGANDVWFVTGGKVARVHHSKNRGAGWIISQIPFSRDTSDSSGIFSIAFDESAKNSVLVGGDYQKPQEGAGTLAISRNGKPWLPASGLNGYRSGVTFVNDKILVAVGSSGSDISRDAGKTWTNLDKENYNAVAAKGENAVWAVGANGLVSKLTIVE